MKTVLLILQIILSLTLTTLIFFQNNSDDGRGNILSSTNNAKRGWEKVVFNFTIFILAAFIISSMIQASI